MNIIKKTYGLEDITSRIPGLFPYIEFDMTNTCTVHPSSDSTTGCYGKLPTALVTPADVFLDIETEGSEQRVIAPNTVYSYRTLMIYYYRYREMYPDSTFIGFVDTGIGKFGITRPDVNSTTNSSVTADEFSGWILVPEYEYYANTGRLYSEYTNIGTMCRKYLEIKAATGETDCELECLLEKYQKMGGDVMMEYYRVKNAVSRELSSRYFRYASLDYTLDFNLNITSSENDLGILNTFLVYFNPRKTYSIGEYAIYNDSTYVCIELFDPSVKYWRGSYAMRGGNGYRCTREHVGEWNESDFELVGNAVQFPGNDAWFVLLYEKYDVDDDTITGTTDSKLRGFRNNKNYIDEGGDIETPGANTDWLWYYMIGDVGYSETTTDEFGNVVVNGVRKTTLDAYEMHLMAYGDVITGIVRDTNAKTITFKYVIGAHLKARYKGSVDDDDNNTHYYYSDYEWDDSDSHGVEYEETYTYEENSDIDMMDDGEFNDYVTYSQRWIADTYKKCEFSTFMPTVQSQMLVDGVYMDYSYITSDFSAHITAEKDSLVSPTLKLDYLGGIAYKPEVKNGVRVSRGNAAAWERHVKLGEIRTFDDLENYANGGFFNIM